MIVDISRQRQLPQCSGCNTPASRGVGALSLPSLDVQSLMSDPKNWLILALLLWLGYSFFFRSRDRDRRKARREDMAKARESYMADIAKIRAKYA